MAVKALFISRGTYKRNMTLTNLSHQQKVVETRLWPNYLKNVSYIYSHQTNSQWKNREEKVPLMIVKKTDDKISFTSNYTAWATIWLTQMHAE